MSVSAKPTRVLFLGCGAAARLHSRTLRRLGKVELLYASRDKARAESYCRQYAGRGAFESYRAALDDARADVAFVVTPTASHRGLALQAIEAGKDVIVEKPAFMHAADVDPVRAAAAKAGRRVFVAENYVYKPVVRLLRSAIERGDLGDVRFIRLDATKWQPPNGWRGDPALSGGGALFEAGIHWISFASNIGLTVARVSARRVGSCNGPDMSSLVVFEYTNGAVGTLAHSWELRAPFRGVRFSKVQGTSGSVTFESNGLIALLNGRRRSLQIGAVRDPLGYGTMLVDFLHALRTGDAPRYTLDAAQRDLSLVEEAIGSMEASCAPVDRVSARR
jgi:predicted dehydrogenase